MSFSVNALFYGDHSAYAVRLIQSLLRSAEWSLIDDVRLACNECSKRTRDFIYGVAGGLPVNVYVYEEENGKNVGKYAMMRRMLYDADRPILSQNVMWFDDDSVITDTTPAWWRKVDRAMADADVLGYIYRSRNPIPAAIRLAISNQPWCTKTPAAQERFRFAQGGWWVARTNILRQWNYPWPELYHNGGDVLLGELCRQQSLRLIEFKDGVNPNAAIDGDPSSAPRRGLKTQWLWHDYTVGKVYSTAHQNFNCTVWANKPVVPAHEQKIASLPPLPTLKFNGLNNEDACAMD